MTDPSDSTPDEPESSATSPASGGLVELRTRVDALRDRIGTQTVSTRTALIVALLLNLQGMLVVLYLGLTNSEVTELRYLLYGLVWVNVGAYAIYAASPPPAEFETRRRAVAIAAGYFALLAVFGGLIGLGVGANATGARIAWLPPGWGPAFVYSGYYLSVTLMPAYVIGYLALAYLVFVTAVDAAGSIVAGVVGLFSCVSCTWPIVAAVASSLLGGGTLLAGSAMSLSYDLSTGVFLLTVALLYWRPGFR